MESIIAYADIVDQTDIGGLLWVDMINILGIPDNVYGVSGDLWEGEQTNILFGAFSYFTLPPSAKIVGLEFTIYVDGGVANSISYSGDPYIYLGTEQQYAPGTIPSFWPIAIAGVSQPTILGGTSEKWGLANLNPARLLVDGLTLFFSVMNLNVNTVISKVDAIKATFYYTESKELGHLRHPRIRR